MSHRAFMVVIVLALAGPSGAAQVHVGAGSSFDLGTGALDLGCADFIVAGDLFAGGLGFSTARNMTIDSSGLVEGESAILQVAGDWNNAGSFVPGTSTVQLVDGCGLTSAVISGDTTFANLEITTTSGFLYSFASGSTQTVTGVLTLAGTAGNLLTIRSTLAGSAAFLDVQGTGGGDFVDVEDNDASAGNPLTLGPNSVTRSNTPGWLTAALLPVLGAPGLMLLALGLLCSGRWILGTGRRSLPSR